MYNRKEQKQEAKSLIRGHQRFFFILFIPFLLTSIVYSILMNRAGFSSTAYTGSISLNDPNVITNYIGSFIFILLSSIFLLSAIYTVFNVLRGKDDFQNPLRKSISFIDNQRLFWGTIWTWILRSILLSLWSFVISIPMIVIIFVLPNSIGFYLASLIIIFMSVFITIKSFAYSQALWVYRDGFLNNEHVGALEAIMTSQDYMKGYKADYFVLQLSFIGWFLLVLLTSGIVGIYVYPYYYTTQVKFYEFIKYQYKQKKVM